MSQISSSNGQSTSSLSLSSSSNNAAAGAVSIHMLAKRGDLKAVQKLLKSKKNENPLGQKDEKGMTPLHLAAEAGHLEICEYFLKQGAKINVIDKEGWSPLHCAASEKHLENSEGTTAIHYLVRNKMSDELRETMEIMIKKGADINAKNKFGETPIHQATLRLNEGMLKVLLSFKADINSTNRYGESCLHKAARMGSPSLAIAKFLLENGADPCLAGANGTPADLVDQEKDRDIYEYLKAEEDKRRVKLTEMAQMDTGRRSGLLMLNSSFRRASQRPTNPESYTPRMLESSVQPSGSTLFEGGCTYEDYMKYDKPAVGWSEGYRIELGSREFNADDFPELNLETHIYRDEFSQKKHYNFIGTMGDKEKQEPFILSVLEQPEGELYLALLVSPAGYERVALSVEAMNEVEADQKKATFAEKVLEVLSDYDLYECDSPQLVKDLIQLETDDPNKTYQFNVGVLFAKKGQTTEKEIYDNETGSEEFENFCHMIGDRIVLEGWNGYRGNLDVKYNSKGTYSLFTHWKEIEIMFHVSTYLPFDASDPDKLQRSGLIRNDIAVIVFQEQGSPFQPDCIISKLNQVILVIQPQPQLSTAAQTFYKLATVSRPDVRPFLPLLPNPPVFSHGPHFRDYLLTKLINGYMEAQKTPAFDRAFKEPRRQNLDVLLRKYPPPKIGKSKKSHSFSTILSKLTPSNVLSKRERSGSVAQNDKSRDKTNHST